MAHRVVIVDVFTAQRYAGNPLAVVIAADAAVVATVEGQLL
jgi:predicted PhzF superfamily epimerase YddE/YHI9